MRRSDDAASRAAAILDALPDGVLVVDLNRQILSCSHSYGRLFGVSADHVAGSVDAVVGAIATQLDNSEEFLAHSNAIWSQPDLVAQDILRFSDGRTYERITAPVRVDSQVAAVVFVVRDISERARAEQVLDEQLAFLEKVQQVAHVGSWVAEYDGSDRIGWSTETHRIFGLASGEFDGTTPRFFERIYAGDRDLVRAARAAACGGERPYDVEYRLVRPDSSVRWVNEKADVIRDVNGAVLRMIGTVQDITERRLLEEQLRQSQKMEAIGRLAGGIAHDLNNALTAIAGYSELALGELEDGHQSKADVEEIRRGAERAGSVTRQLLAFSRKEILEPRLFDLNETIQSLGRFLARLLGTDIQVSTDLAPSVPAILGDPGQVEQAVINLAVNARDAMPRGGRVVLATSIEDLDEDAVRGNAPMTPGRYVVLRVSDTGHGMTPETQARIFEPFFTTKGTGKGTGLGLSMVYGTLKQIGGFIFVDSEIGRGTTFRLYFRPSAPALAGPPPAARIEAAHDRGGETLLVVEDEPAVRNLVASALRDEGYRLLLAGSAAEGLRIAEDHKDTIHLLLTDAIMPGKSGLELAKLLVVKRPQMRVIVMSGYTEETLHGLGGGVTLLQKPFAPRELRRRIREVLDQVRQRAR